MMQFAERLLRKHPQHITLLAPFYHMDVDVFMRDRACGLHYVSHHCRYRAEKRHSPWNARWRWPLLASQMAITASPVSVAVVSLVSILGAQHGIGHAWGILEILAVSVPASLFGVAIAALWSLRRGKDLADDVEFQERIKDPKQREFIYGGTETLMNQRFPKTGVLVHVDLLCRDCRGRAAGGVARAAASLRREKAK